MNPNGNGKTEPIVPWGFVVTIESTKRIDPLDLVDILDEYAASRSEIVSIQVEALGPINVSAV